MLVIPLGHKNLVEALSYIHVLLVIPATVTLTVMVTLMVVMLVYKDMPEYLTALLWG